MRYNFDEFAEYSKGMHHTTAHCGTLQHTATHCNTLQQDETELRRVREVPEGYGSEEAEIMRMYFKQEVAIWKSQLATILTMPHD